MSYREPGWHALGHPAAPFSRGLSSPVSDPSLNPQRVYKDTEQEGGPARVPSRAPALPASVHTGLRRGSTETKLRIAQPTVWQRQEHGTRGKFPEPGQPRATRSSRKLASSQASAIGAPGAFVPLIPRPTFPGSACAESSEHLDQRGAPTGSGSLPTRSGRLVTLWEVS